MTQGSLCFPLLDDQSLLVPDGMNVVFVVFQLYQMGGKLHPVTFSGLELEVVWFIYALCNPFLNLHLHTHTLPLF